MSAQLALVASGDEPTGEWVESPPGGCAEPVLGVRVRRVTRRVPWFTPEPAVPVLLLGPADAVVTPTHLGVGIFKVLVASAQAAARRYGLGALCVEAGTAERIAPLRCCWPGWLEDEAGNFWWRPLPRRMTTAAVVGTLADQIEALAAREAAADAHAGEAPSSHVFGIADLSLPNDVEGGWILLGMAEAVRKSATAHGFTAARVSVCDEHAAALMREQPGWRAAGGDPLTFWWHITRPHHDRPTVAGV